MSVVYGLQYCYAVIFLFCLKRSGKALLRWLSGNEILPKTASRKFSVVYHSQGGKESNEENGSTDSTHKPKRCLTVEEFQAYCSIGRNNALKLIKKSKAGIRAGKKILVDRVAFDKWLDLLEEEADVLAD